MTLEEWADLVTADLGLAPDPGRSAHVRDVILDLARDAAHGVARPAAPLTTFLLGVAVGGGRDLDDTAARIRALIPPPDPDAEPVRPRS